MTMHNVSCCVVVSIGFCLRKCVFLIRFKKHPCYICSQSLNRIFIVFSLESSTGRLLTFHCCSTRSSVRLYSLFSLFFYVYDTLRLSSYPEKFSTYPTVFNDSLCCSLINSAIISALLSLSIPSCIICIFGYREPFIYLVY